MKIRFSALAADRFPYYLWLGSLVALMACGGLAAWYMEHQGHYVTGMDNQIVWGMPHVFAIFLIVIASGTLNVASIASVFGKTEYKPLTRLSGLLAIGFLTGGLAILVLDLGRPDRLIVAMTYYNFKSIFAWNIFLYTGFFVVVIVYLWTMFERRMVVYTKMSGLFALIWRIVLTTGTGAIFGFLVARQAYDAAIMAPLFIMLSFSAGTAALILVLVVSCACSGRHLGNFILGKLRDLLGIFVAVVLYFTLAYNLTNLYATEHHGVQDFLLLSGGVYPLLFWAGQIGLGGIVPLILFFVQPFRDSRAMLMLGTVLALLGVAVQIYVIVVGGQAYPLVMFPGMEESSSFFDGVIAHYTPSLPEIVLGVGGVALALAVVVFMLAVLEFLPESLADTCFDLPESSK